MRILDIPARIDIDRTSLGNMAESRIIDSIVVILFAPGTDLPGESLLAAGHCPVIEHREAPAVHVVLVFEHLRVVYVHRLTVLNMESSGDTVIRVEETGVYPGDDIHPLLALTGTEFGKSLADVLSVVPVLVSVRVRDNVFRIRCSDVHASIVQVNLQHMDVSRDVRAGIVAIFDSGTDIGRADLLPVIVCVQSPVHRIFQHIQIMLRIDDSVHEHRRRSLMRVGLMLSILTHIAIAEVRFEAIPFLII